MPYGTHATKNKVSLDAYVEPINTCTTSTLLHAAVERVPQTDNDVLQSGQQAASPTLVYYAERVIAEDKGVV